MVTVKLNVSEPRMIKLAEAAEYTGLLPTRQFKTHCPVAPVEVAPGQLRWDRRDLDRWIDSLKTGADQSDADAIIARLG